jgi:hypothetical protein
VQKLFNLSKANFHPAVSPASRAIFTTGPITLRTFRFLVVASFLMSLSGLFFELVIPNPAAEFLRPFQDYAPANPKAIYIAGVVIGLVAFIFQIVSLIGLYLLKTWSRWLALMSIVLMPFCGPLMGYSVVSGGSEALTSFANIIFGGVIALAYYSPLRRAFSRQRGKSTNN